MDYISQREAEAIQNEADYHQGYWDGYTEGEKGRAPRWQQADIKPDDVRKHYGQGYINGHGDALAGLSCNPAGEAVEGWKCPVSYFGPEF